MKNEGTIFIRCNSHRARDKVLWHLGKGRQSYYPRSRIFKGDRGKGTYLVTPEEFEKVKDISGVTRCRDQNPESYSICW